MDEKEILKLDEKLSINDLALEMYRKAHIRFARIYYL